MSKGTVFLDYDGTLHDCLRIYAPAFRKVEASLIAQGRLPQAEHSDEWIGRWLGWSVQDMWAEFAPGLPEEIWAPASHEIGQIMTELTETGVATLYPGSTEVLRELRDAGYELVILSNCEDEYRDLHTRVFNLDELVDAFYTSEEFDNIPKWQIYQQVSVKHPLPHVMVGDRFKDFEVATANGIPAIGCSFGYGNEEELAVCDIVIDSISELPDAVNKLLAH